MNEEHPSVEETVRQRTETLDQAHIDEAAAWARRELARVGHARVELTPGDMTRYSITVVGGLMWTRGGVMPRDEYTVALALFGRAYPWSGEIEIEASYAAEKWTLPSDVYGTRLWTGHVLARFLNALARELR